MPKQVTNTIINNKIQSYGKRIGKQLFGGCNQRA